MRNNLTSWIKPASVLVVIALLALNLIVHFTQPTSKPQPATDTVKTVSAGLVPKAREVATHTVQYIEKPVVEVKYIEQEREVPVELQNFESIDELELWLESRKDITTVYFESPGTIIDCDDYASDMQRNAIRDGYLVSFQIINTDEYNRLFTESQLPPDTLHAINLAVIGNAAYYFEPQTGEIVLAAYID